MRLIDADKLEELCDIMADKCDGIGESIWHQFRTVVECSPSVEPTQTNAPNALNALDCVDTISRKAALDALCDNCNYLQAKCAHYPCDQFVSIEQLPSAESQWCGADMREEPSQVARDIATIIENEKDMRVILNNEMVARKITEEANKACAECQEFDCWGCVYRDWRNYG